MAEGKYIKQKRDSIWLFYSDVDGKLLSSETYKKGVLHGITKTFYPKTGNVAESIEYVNGIKEGPYKKYFPDGALMTEGTYVNDLLDGKFTLYHPNGNIQVKGNYKNGRQTGNWNYFDEDGNAVSEDDFKKDNIEEEVQK
jgi:antitoxin component YwqK of YwqJK toxin-antitoxin module